MSKIVGGDRFFVDLYTLEIITEKTGFEYQRFYDGQVNGINKTVRDGEKN